MRPYLFLFFLLDLLHGRMLFAQQVHFHFSDEAMNAKWLIRDHHYELLDTIHLLEGSFRASFRLPEAEGRFYYLSHGSGEILFWLKDGNSLVLQKKGSDLVLDDANTPENKYLFAKQQFTQSIPMEWKAYNIYAQLDAGEFVAQTDEFLAGYDSVYQEYKTLLSPAFNELESANLQIFKAIRLAQFETQKRLVTGSTYSLPADYPDPYTNVDLNNPRLLSCPRYLDLVHTKVDKSAMKITAETEHSDFFIVYLESLRDREFHPSIRDQLGFRVAEYGFAYSTDIDLFYETYLSFAKDEILIRQFKSAYFEKKAEAGQPAPNFTWEDKAGKTWSLDDVKGQYVYIDIWASWCTPCIKQIPYLKQLETDFGEKVHFVSVAWKDRPSSWQAAIDTYDLSGIQLIAPDPMAAFFQFFNVSGIPRFILLDPQGLIIDSRARQPSDPELRTQLEQLD